MKITRGSVCRVGSPVKLSPRSHTKVDTATRPENLKLNDAFIPIDSTDNCEQFLFKNCNKLRIKTLWMLVDKKKTFYSKSIKFLFAVSDEYFTVSQ